MKSVKVAELPTIRNSPEPAPVSHIFPHVLAAPKSSVFELAVAFVAFIVEVVAVIVKLVGVVKSQITQEPVNVKVPDPIVKVLVLELSLTKSFTVTLKLFALKVPCVRVSLLVQIIAS